MDGPGDEARTPAKGAWTWLALLIVLTLSSALCAYNLDGLVDPIKATLHFSDGQISFLLGWAFVGTYALASLPGGWIIDHAPRKPVLVVGAILWGGGALTCGLGHSFAALCAGRVLVGLGQATLAPATMSILSDCFPARLRARVLGAALAAAGVGPGVGLTCTGLMLGVAARFGVEPAMAWRVAIIACAAPTLLIVAGLPWVAEPPRQDIREATSAGMDPGGRFWALLAITLLAVGAVTLSDGAQLSWSAAALVREHAVSVADAAKGAGLVFIFCGAVGPLVAGSLADLLYRRHGVSGRLFVALAAVALLIPLQFLYRTSTARELIFVLIGAGLTVVTGEVVGATVLQDLVPDNRRGLAASANSVFSSVAIGIGTTGVAVMSKHHPSSGHPIASAMSLVTVPASILALLIFFTLLFAVRRPGVWSLSPAGLPDA